MLPPRGTALYGRGLAALLSFALLAPDLSFAALSLPLKPHSMISSSACFQREALAGVPLANEQRHRVLQQAPRLGRLYRRSLLEPWVQPLAAVRFLPPLNGSEDSPGKDGRNRRFTPDQWDILQRAAQLCSLDETGRLFLQQVWLQRLFRDPDKEPLLIRMRHRSKAGNFIMGVALDENEKKAAFGTVASAAIEADQANLDAASDVVATVVSSEAGLGSGLVREEWKKLHRIEKTGAKSWDMKLYLGFRGAWDMVSIAEGSLLSLIALGQRRLLHWIYFQPLVNWQSLKAYQDLFNMEVAYDRGPRRKPGALRRTYRRLMNQAGIELVQEAEQLLQPDLPPFDPQTGQLSLSNDALRQPGGHGYWGFYFLWQMYKNPPPDDGKTHIVYFKNGDNWNGLIKPAVAGFASRNRVPIIRVMTPLTPIDFRGARDGLKIYRRNGKTFRIPQQMELSDAIAADEKDAGQRRAFELAGRYGDEAGKQPFLTNLFYFNHNELHAILKKLADVVGKEELQHAITPTLLPKPQLTGNDGRSYEPIDSAIGSAIYNLNAYLLTHPDRRVRRILSDLGIARLVVSVESGRDIFLPIKYASDFWFLASTDWWKLNSRTWLWEAAVQRPPPEIRFRGPYWDEVLNLIRALGFVRVQELQELVIDGPEIDLPEKTILAGQVHLLNETGGKIDMRKMPIRHLLDGYFGPEGFTLRDIELRFVDVRGQIDLVERALPPPNPARGEASVGVLLALGFAAWFSWLPLMTSAAAITSATAAIALLVWRGARSQTSQQQILQSA
jgi:hypothetical protein